MNNIFVYKSHLLRIPNWKNHRLVFPVVMYGCEKLDHTEGLMLKNWCFWTVMLEKTLESPLDWKEIKPVHPKWNQPWIFIGRTDAVNTLATWCEEVTHFWKRPWCWERLKAGGEGDDRGWDGWMASPTRWTWVWVNSGSWWWTGRPGVLQSMGLQKGRHDWVTEPNWRIPRISCFWRDSCLWQYRCGCIDCPYHKNLLGPLKNLWEPWLAFGIGWLI